ncbi:MAG: redoxin domain-containing protein [Opitutaceae bacterium]|nr:redoxin domain-containing protein [Opitutaceae bacterium]
MKYLNQLLIAGLAFAATLSVGLAATAQVGKAAPDFTLTDINGKAHRLSDYKGKTVVLEWVNPDCPFVVKHYDKSSNIPKTQAAAKAEGVVWLTINSAHPGAQGDYSPDQVAEWQKRNNAAYAAYLRDQDGKVGKLYDARTTPHLYIIDGAGTLVYAGGIDSIRSSRVDDIPKATNYVLSGLEDLKAGRALRTSNSQPYGCSVKYAN